MAYSMDDKLKVIGYKQLHTNLDKYDISIFYKDSQCIIEYFGQKIYINDTFNLDTSIRCRLRVRHIQCCEFETVVIDDITSTDYGRCISIIEYKGKIVAIKGSIAIPLNDGILVVCNDMMLLNNSGVKIFRGRKDIKQLNLSIIEHLISYWYYICRLNNNIALYCSYYIDLEKGKIENDFSERLKIEKVGTAYKVNTVYNVIDIQNNKVEVKYNH